MYVQLKTICAYSCMWIALTNIVWTSYTRLTFFIQKNGITLAYFLICSGGLHDPRYTHMFWLIDRRYIHNRCYHASIGDTHKALIRIDRLLWAMMHKKLIVDIKTTKCDLYGVQRDQVGKKATGAAFFLHVLRDGIYLCCTR